MTSHDVVDFIRKRFDLNKVGHAGTLDPMATGILVILIGKLTKSSSAFMSGDKEYEATITLGATSDTCDAWGKIKSSGKRVEFKEEEIKKVFEKFTGEVLQTPPAYSAVKHEGRKLYEFARKGVHIKKEPRKIFIKRIDIEKISLPEISFKVTCTKGTYIRQLASDIGGALGCGAYLSHLKRTRSGDFGIDKAVGMEELKTIGADELGRRLG